MADITGNPTPLNVPAPQDANGTLSPKTGSAADVATTQAAIGTPVTADAPLTLPSTPNAVEPPGVPVAVAGAVTYPTVASQVTPPPATPDLKG